MLGDDLGIYCLVISDDNPPTRARAKEDYVQPAKHVNSKYLSTHRFKFRETDENFYPLPRGLPLPPAQEFPFRVCCYHVQVVYGWEILNYVTELFLYM